MTIIIPKSDLLLSKCLFVLGLEQQCAFDVLKSKLTSAPVLNLQDVGKLFKPCCDAALVGLGAELSHK